MGKKDLIYSYDKKRDVLYVSIGEPKEAISSEICDDVFINRDPKTKKIVGFTIINFQKKFAKTKNKKFLSFHIPVHAEFQM